MDTATRNQFDTLLEDVLSELPPHVHELIERVPLHVEDYPSSQVMEALGVRSPDHLCGLFTGIPINEQSVLHSGNLPNVVTIYRRGILALSRNRLGRIDQRRLRDEIRITVLHELAHHHGLDEDELAALGFG